MEDTIIRSRITPKRPGNAILTRERLIDLINKNIHKNIILIIGPAGFGKTTLIVDYFNSSGINYAWFYLAPDINGFGSFARYFVHSLRELNSEFGTKTLELLNSMIESGVLMRDEKNSINAFIGTLTNELSSIFKEDVYIVIDDIHNSRNAEWLTLAFNSLIDDFPSNLHIIITSRELPEFNLASMNSKRNLLKIDADELNFNIGETGKLLKDIYSISCGESEIELLDKKAQGWITGLHLILQTYGKDFGKVLQRDMRIDENIFLYFAEEIFKSLDERTQQFLVITSLVDSFNEDLFSSIPEIENAGWIIEDLKKKNIFLETLDTGSDNKDRSYCYHNLFKQFLNMKLAELKSNDEIKNISSQIFNYYLRKNDTVNAIDFAIKAKDFTKAAELVADCFEELFRNGRYEQLDKWVNLLPEDVIHGNIKLKYYSARLLKHFKADLESAWKSFGEISERENKDSKYYILSRTELADILIERGKAKEAADSLEGLLGGCTDAKLKVRILLCLTKAYYNLGASYYSELVSALDEAIKLNEESGIRDYHAEIYSYYGKFYLNTGEFSRALHYFRNVVQLENNIYRRFQTIIDIVLLQSWSGEYFKAKESLEEAQKVYEKFPINIFKRELMRVTALNASECGDFEHGIEMLTLLIEFDAKNNIQTHTFWYLMLIGETHLKLDRIEKAKEYFKLAEKSMDPNDSQQKLEYDLNLAMLKKSTKPDSRTEMVLLNTFKYLNDAGLVYSKSQIEFYLADFYYITGKQQTALKYMNDALDIASQKGFSSFLIQDFIAKRYLFDLAASNKQHADFIHNLYIKLLERESYFWVSDECRKRWVNERDKLFDIKLNTFGGVDIFVRGEAVEENKWIRKKSKLLLVYLLVNREVKHSKEKILNLFFRELSPSTAENIFHQAISNIRNVIKLRFDYPAEKPQHRKRKTRHETGSDIAGTDSFIRYEDKILRIAAGYNYYVDVNEFVSLSNQLKSTGTNTTQKELLAKNAVELYKGELLPGYYDEWIEELRMNLQNRFIELCEDLIELLKKIEKYDEVALYGEKLISEDKLHSGAFVNVINAYAKTGNKSMARKKYDQLLKNYEEEYGEKPIKEILDRIGSILAG